MVFVLSTSVHGSNTQASVSLLTSFEAEIPINAGLIVERLQTDVPSQRSDVEQTENAYLMQQIVATQEKLVLTLRRQKLSSDNPVHSRACLSGFGSHQSVYVALQC